MTRSSHTLTRPYMARSSHTLTSSSPLCVTRHGARSLRVQGAFRDAGGALVFCRSCLLPLFLPERARETRDSVLARGFWRQGRRPAASARTPRCWLAVLTWCELISRLGTEEMAPGSRALSADCRAGWHEEEAMIHAAGAAPRGAIAPARFLWQPVAGACLRTVNVVHCLQTAATAPPRFL